MSLKGKERAIAAYEEDEDEDDILAYFTAKKRDYTRPRSPLRHISPPRPVLSDVSEDDTDDEDGDGVKKKRRRKKKQPIPMKLPDWTRQSSVENRRKKSVGRGSTEERREAPIVIDDSDDEGNGKEQVRNGRSRVKLTPPPELTEARKAELRAVMEKHFAPDPVDPLAHIEEPVQSSPYAPPSTTNRTADTVIITVRMVADPERAAAGASANAIRAYERGRQINLRRDQALNVVYTFLASQINKQPDEIVLVLNGQKIYSSSVTPKSLRMSGSVELTGYETYHWERLEKEKQRERQRILYDGSPPLEIHEPPSPEIRAVDPLPEPIRTKKLRLSLRGKWGEFRMNVIGDIDATALIKWYVMKAGKDQTAADGLALHFDGERIAPDTMVRDMEVEDKDLVDIV